MRSRETRHARTCFRTQHVSHVVPVPVPGPPAKVITTLGMSKGRNAENPSSSSSSCCGRTSQAEGVRQASSFRMHGRLRPRICCGSLVCHTLLCHLLQFEGYGSWKTQWSHEHQRYCCYKFKESCVTKAGVSLKLSWLCFRLPLLCCVSCQGSVSESRLKHGRHCASHVRGNVAVAGLAAAVAKESLQDHHAHSSRDRARESRGAGAATSRNQSHRPCSRPCDSYARVNAYEASYQWRGSCFEAARIPAPSSRSRLLGHLAS